MDQTSPEARHTDPNGGIKLDMRDERAKQLKEQGMLDPMPEWMRDKVVDQLIDRPLHHRNHPCEPRAHRLFAGLHTLMVCVFGPVATTTGRPATSKLDKDDKTMPVTVDPHGGVHRPTWTRTLRCAELRRHDGHSPPRPRITASVAPQSGEQAHGS
ncbi:hypothetical protein FRAAL0209 [Frankia alni ACN14a]|uniref:Uncharacterized protein n=1 Tax=Frankia alni (strain DSM 45986 / CECT 9034 / ACN14a) TaxID=326424 RepID=Q0RU57_FRAAA|nr:hypothetical protein FRAAL0209 [Frankia alni ACN14a]